MILPEYSLYQLLSESKAIHHAHIRDLWSDPENHYLVVFQKDSEEEKAVLSVGPDLDYRSINDVLEVEIDGMRPRAYVRSRHCPKHTRTGYTSNIFSSAQVGDRAIPRPVEHTQSVMAAVPSNADWERLKQKEEQIRAQEEELNARECYIIECENRLSMLAEEYHARDVELTHREEQLNEQEFKLAQRESELSLQAVGC